MLELDCWSHKIRRGEDALLEHDSYTLGNDDTVLVDRLYARLESHRWNPKNPDLVVYVRKGDKYEVYDQREIYRMPVPEDDKTLTELLELAVKQWHT